MIYEFDSKRPRIHSSAYISDSATIIGDVQIGARCYVGPGAVIRGDEKPIVIGDETAVEDCAVIHVGGSGSSGCYIGKRVTIGHGAIVHGNVIRDSANIGMGAIISIYAEVGEYAVVAEGAVVKRGQVIPRRSSWAGLPPPYFASCRIRTYIPGRRASRHTLTSPPNATVSAYCGSSSSRRLWCDTPQNPAAGLAPYYAFRSACRSPAWAGLSASPVEYKTNPRSAQCVPGICSSCKDHAGSTHSGSFQCPGAASRRAPALTDLERSGK